MLTLVNIACGPQSKRSLRDRQQGDKLQETISLLTNAGFKVRYQDNYRAELVGPGGRIATITLDLSPVRIAL